jgi:hypothetical protein
MKGKAGIWIAIFVLAAVGVIAFIAYGSLSPGGPRKERVQQWVASTNLGQSLGTLHEDSLHIAKVLAEHRGTGALHTDCSLLSTDAGTANDNLPSPDDQLTSLLAQAYALYYQAGDLCYTAGVSGTQLLAQSAAKRAQAGQLVAQALARIRAVTGRTVSTTTTTVPTTGGIFG